MSLFVVSEHDQRFDRQTRIWGAHGQEAIEKCHLCVLDAGPTSAETLKNLVLPNVGSFTLVDDKLVSQEDLGNNFFVDPSSLGKPRVQAVTDLLLELNENVKGHAVNKNPVHVIEKEPAFFDKFNLVIASQLPEKPLLQLADYLWKKNIPLLVLRSYGLIGYVRLAVPEMLVVESHYENDRSDLYIHPEQLAHFPELKAYCESFLVDELKDDSKAHSHVPYIAILVHELKKWQAKHGNKMPSTFEETKEFKQQIVNSALDFGKQENFGEAVNFAYRVYKKPEIEDDVQEILNHSKCLNLAKDAPNFWILARALREFVHSDGHGFLPVSASIPDMTALTSSYVTLQQIFAKRAAADVAAFTKHVSNLLKSIGRAADAIPQREIDYFVSNVRGLKQVQYRSLAQEHDSKQAHKEHINDALEDWEPAPADGSLRPKDIHWYFGLRACEMFNNKFGRYPGAGKFTSLEDEAATLTKIQEEWLKECGINTPVVKECLQELIRFGPSEIHNTAAFLGGVGSQVALKIILRQFIPLNNTLIHNAIHGRQSAYEF